MNGTPARVVAYVVDLMDRSKVTAAAAGSAGIEIVFVRSQAKLVDALSAGDRDATTVVVDLGRPDAIEAIAAVAPIAGGVQVVAFGPHVDTDRLEEARRAGAATVLARSTFFSDPARWMGG